MPDLIFSLAKILVVGLFTTQTGIAYRQNETGTAPTEASTWPGKIASAGGEFERVNVSEPCDPAIVSPYFGSAP